MPRGGTSPQGAPARVPARVACLDRNYRQIRGGAAKKRGCRKVGRFPTSGIAYHPFTPPAARTSRGPRRRRDRPARPAARHARRARPPRQAAASAADLDHRVRLPDRPPDPFQARRSSAPRPSWTRASGSPSATGGWRATRSHALRRPARPGRQPLRWSSWQAGLYFLNGKRKPHVYDAFRLPVFVRALSGNRVEIFGGRHAVRRHRADRVKGLGASYRSLGTVEVNQTGYFRRVFRVTSAARGKYRVTLDGYHVQAAGGSAVPSTPPRRIVQ